MCEGVAFVGRNDVVLECVINVSEGRDRDLIAEFAATVDDCLLDVHVDPDHNRSVFTLVGTQGPRRLARLVTSRLTIGSHVGVHPRLGVLDVVPFVPLADSTMDHAISARDDFARWIAEELAVPAFRYGPERTLPEVRKRAFTAMAPDHGPRTGHPTAGAVCVGARAPLVAWNMWLEGVDIDRTRRLAATLRSDTVRTLGLQVGRFTQVSCNLIAPELTGPDEVHDALSTHVEIQRCELVGLIPRSVLEAIEESRWEQLDIAIDKTIEQRLERLASNGPL